MSEYFDVLDENGDYTGRVETRETCHKNGLVHKAVAAFIINSNKQVLLQKRSKNQRMWPGMWDLSSGGHVDSGELGFQAIGREIKEELGIEVEKKDMTFIGSSFSTNLKGDIVNKHINEYYIINKDLDETKLKLQTEEVDEVKWMDKDEIIKRVQNDCDGITDKRGAWKYLVKYYEWLENNQ